MTNQANPIKNETYVNQHISYNPLKFGCQEFLRNSMTKQTNSTKKEIYLKQPISYNPAKLGRQEFLRNSSEGIKRRPKTCWK
jgi:hypothetical protein